MQLHARLAVCSLLFVVAAPLHAQSANSEAASITQNVYATTPVAAPAAAQAPAAAAPAVVTSIPLAVEPAPAAAAEPRSVGGAPMTGLRVGVHAQESSRASAPTMAAAGHANLGQSEALMVVGFAGLVVGAIIGGTPGTIIMVGGALVGLKGLYDYLQ
ncbi:MAG TPA: hypothetical protein VGM67_07880 [Gemmatimonadaceae bacterium]|jgi:hypothetical protein